MNKISGVGYAEASDCTVSTMYGDVEIRVIGKQQLIKNKTSTDWLKDQADAEEVQRADD